MLSSSRNQRGLSEEKVENCQAIWEYLEGSRVCPLLVDEATEHGSRTRFHQAVNAVYLGADVEPGQGTEARVLMSEVSCLAHELAHAERFRMGIDRTVDRPDVFLDEAEASLYASFLVPLSEKERKDLVEDARTQIAAWQAATANRGTSHES